MCNREIAVVVITSGAIISILVIDPLWDPDTVSPIFVLLAKVILI